MAIDEKAIFDAALALPDDKERESYIQEACTGHPELLDRLRELLSAHAESHGPLDRLPVALGATVDAAPGEAPGTVIGPYKLIEPIGEGGMGSVWMAQQTEPVKRLVALKLIKAGMDSKQVIARFEAERQALALMDHPNIAKIFDGGITQAHGQPSVGLGRPYFVMELVKGIPITKYCDEHHLTPRQRLELFIPVCQAIQHAHQKRIIHRDIKPSNVMVAMYDDRPVLKVIDFGVAKATGQQLTEATLHTGFGAVVGTIEYMSPEQASFNQLDVDTRSDIYSLGVLLYELLAGSPPFTKKELEKAGMLEMLRIIREQEPSKPSTKLSSSEALPSLSANRGMEPARLTRLVRGELDWIVMKALEKDRNRRYESANGFAMDVQRYLADETVQACPPSAGYRLRKFARRNRGPVVAATLVVLALVSGIIGTTWGMFRATVAEADAVIQAKQKEQERDRAVRASERATRAERDARHRLFQAKVAEAKASLSSRQPGQRLVTWKAVTEAAELARGLGLDEDVFVTLRSEAIACLGLTDVRLVKEWQAYPPGSTGVCFDANLKHYARTNSKGIISVRQLDDDRQLQELTGNDGGAVFMKFSPNGALLAVRYGRSLPGQSTNFELWDWQQGKVVFKPTFPVDFATALCFSPDGRFLALGQGDGTITFYEPATGKVTNPISVGGNPTNPTLGKPTNLAFSPDSARLAVGRYQEVQVREVASGNLIHKLPVPGLESGAFTPSKVVWHPDGVLLGVSGIDSNIYLWDTVTGEQRGVLRGHSGAVSYLAFAASGDTLVSSAPDGSIRLWDPWSGRELVRFAGTAPQLSGDGRRLVSLNLAGTGSLWDVAEARECRTLPRSGTALGKEEIGHGSFSPNGRWLAMGSSKGTRVWDMVLRKEVAFMPSSLRMFGVMFHPKGKQLFTSSVCGLYDLPVQEHEGVLRLGPARKLPVGSVHQISLDREGRILGAAATHKGLILDATDLAGNVRQVSHVSAQFAAISPNGKWLATGTKYARGGVKLWETQTGKLLVDLIQEDRIGIVTVAFSPDGRWLVTRMANKFAIWATPQDDEQPDAAASWQLQREIVTERGTDHCAFSSDGEILALMLSPSVVRLLDPKTERTFATWAAADIDDQVWLVGFSPDNTQFVMATPTGGVRVWDMRRIREQLKEIGLDWDLSAYAPAPAPGEIKPMRVELDLGELAPHRQDVDKKLPSVVLSPKDTNIRGPFGTALYRAGDWKGSIVELEKAISLRKPDDPRNTANGFVLAMAHWQLGEKQKASEWYDRAVAWMEKNQPNDVELPRLRAEATALLKIEEKPKPK